MVMLLCRLNSSFKNSAQPFPLEFFVFLQIQISQIIKITKSLLQQGLGNIGISEHLQTQGHLTAEHYYLWQLIDYELL